MYRLICSVIAILLLLSGCSSNETPTRPNDFTPLTSIEIVAATPSIAAGTSTRLTVIGNYSGEFTRDDITAQAVWLSSEPSVASVITVGSQTRVSSHLHGSVTLTATVGSVAAIPFKLTVTDAKIKTVTITPVAPTVALGLKQQFTASGVFEDNTSQDLTFDATWSSDNPAAATVSDAADSKGLAQTVAAGTANINATFDFKSGTTAMTVTAPLLQSITVSPVNPTLLSQSATKFIATGHYSDGSNTDITNQVVWTSSQTNVATITATGGALKSVVPGTTAISAGLNGISGATNLKVTGGILTGFTLNPANPGLAKGTGTLMTATGSFSNGSKRDITGVIDWTVANTAIAEMTFPGANLAMLNALEVTAAPIIVTAKSGILNTDANLTVTSSQLSAGVPLSISPASLDLIAATSGRFTLTANFINGPQDVTASAVWSSGNAATAAVGNGLINGGRVSGSAASNSPVTISATYGNFTVTAPVTVIARTVTVLTISGSQALRVGDQVKYTATASYSGASPRDVTADVTWSSDQPNIAALVDNLTQPGELLAVDSGTATLTAVFPGIAPQTLRLTIQ